MESSDELKCIDMENGNLRVLDQLLLPNTVHWVDVKNLQDTWTVIKEMKVRGAPLIAVVALQGLKIELLNNRKEIHSDYNKLSLFLKESSTYLKTSRPTAVNLSNDLDDLLNGVSKISDAPNLLTYILQFIQRNFDNYVNSSTEMAKIGADLILEKFKDYSRKLNIMTICNTGKLAMPGIGTALGIIREIHRREKLDRLYIPETRPYNQGSRLTAFEAVHDNLPGILIADSMSASLMKAGKVDLVIVGADRVTRNGSTANKIGTYTLAVNAKHHGLPFYVACPWSTIDMTTLLGRDIVIEQRPPDELKKIGNILIAPEQINVHNPSFDVTPGHLIDSIITEKGCFEFKKEIDLNEDWELLEIKNIPDYLKKIKLIEQDESCTVEDVADGNLNNVYKIVTNQNKSFCLKQALPYVKCIGPSWPLTLKRSLFEAEGLKFEQNLCPNLVPKFIHYDSKMAILIMEFLDNHVILRSGLIKGIQYVSLGKVLAEFCARTLFYSSSLYLNPETLREKISFWNENSLCALTEKVVFSDPYVVSDMNRWTSPQLDEINQSFKQDSDLILQVHKLRQKFINKKEALIHGDLHSGSVMVGEKNLSSIKIIDSEFSFYGPIAYDTGNVLAHLIISYFTHDNNKNYQNYLKDEIKTFYNLFEKDFVSYWRRNDTNSGTNEELMTGYFFHKEFPGLNQTISEKIYQSYMKENFHDTLGFTGTEIIRRILGVAHVKDFDSIEHQDKRSQCELKALLFAKEIITKSDKYHTVEQILDLI